ncbi:LysR substrate-binding domain-containing protein [Actinocatenispora sera]|uniref:LysR substrate-binding domain-containing protein n=1 Tax=Actinocatenispora sera TaxID=390989 RepID=UPI0033E8E19A
MYNPEHLRSFLAVSESLSFTRAAAALGIRQPTVSQHIRKLEDEVGRPLLVRDTRTVALTADGEAMARFARTIIAANEAAVGHFTGSELSGRLQFGVTDDLALTPVPKILREFRRLYPQIVLELTVSQSLTLQRRVESGHLDAAFVKYAPGEGHGRLVQRDPLVWAAVEDAHLDLTRPLPLIVYHAPSMSRSRGVQALEAAGIPYRISCTVRGVNGVLAAARAGLGVAIFARSLVPADLVELPADAGLPELGETDLVLLTNPHAAGDAVEALTSAILSRRNPIRNIAH